MTHQFASFRISRKKGAFEECRRYSFYYASYLDKYKNKSFSFSLDLIHLSVIEYNSNYYYNLMSVPFYYCMSGQKVFSNVS